MEFPKEFWDKAHWKIIKNGEDLWLPLSTGEEKRIGLRTVYEKIKDPRQKILEVNVFQKGVVAQMWFPDYKNSPKVFYSRILKDGKWVYGIFNAPVELEGLRVDGKFCGVRVSLRIAEDKIEIVNILKK